MKTDEFFLLNLKQGDEKAYKQLFDLYYSNLCLLACQYVKDYYEAETIVSDVFYNLWKNREIINIHTSIRKYLIIAVKNRSLNYLNEIRNQEVLRKGVKSQIDRMQDLYHENSDYPLTRMLEKELDAKIEESLKKLPPLTREIFELSRFSQLRYQEIAEQTGLSVDSIKYHIKQALLNLREEFKNYFLCLLIFFLM